MLCPGNRLSCTSACASESVDENREVKPRRATTDAPPPRPLFHYVSFLFFSFLLFQITATFKPSDDRYVINAAPRT